jgi:hypothetical protein
MSDQFKEAMTAWVLLKKQLSAARADIKLLNTQEKNLRTFIQGFMKEQKINTCNVSDENAKVTLNTRKVKTPFTRDLVKKALLRYFRGDESLVQRVFELIDEEKEVTERDSISLKV